MSSKKTVQRRLSLLAGSSLIAATLSAAALTLTPTVALAANECNPIGVAPSANGATADSYTCTGATTYQTSGVTYSSAGNLTVAGSGALDVGAVGINLTGNTTDNVIFTANNRLTGTSGAVVDITSVSGNITATNSGASGGIDASAAGVTHAVRLQSTGGGNITYSKTSTGANGGIDNDVAGGEAAIAAITNGGNIVMTIANGGGNNSGVAGRLRGIVAQTSGAGSVTLTTTGATAARSAVVSDVDGIAALDITAGTGGVTINMNGGGFDGGAGDAIRIASAGAVTINNNAGRITGSVDFSGVTAGGVVFSNSGTGNTATGGRWLASGTNIFSSQNDTLNLAGTNAHIMFVDTTVEFGGGADTLNMSGVLLANGVTITNLEAFNNSGAIYLGGAAQAGGDNPIPDELADDILSLAGTTFTGSGASQVILGVSLSGVAQVGCEMATGAADCLDLRGGATAGSTLVTVIDVSPDAQLSGYVPQGITFIDVAGGTTDPGHFTFDFSGMNGSVHPLYGEVFERPGHFVYMYRYDEENQRHQLISQPRNGDLFEYAALSGAAQSIWHMTAETVTDRQMDLRGGAEGGSVWLRGGGEYSKRDVSTTFVGYDDTYAFDNNYKLYAGEVVGGMDVLVGRSGGYDYVFGAQLGYVSSSLDFDASESSGKMTGATGGIYGSVWSDRFFLDGTFNVNGLALDYDAPATNSKTTTYVNTFGARLDGGMRWMLSERTYVEPLATLAFARTSFEEISITGATIRPADSNSRRGALGLRAGADLTEGAINVGYFVAGRAWNEFDGDSDGVIANPGVDLPFADEFSGGFGEAEAGVNLYSDDGTLSGYLSSGVKFKDGYSATNLSLGIRMRW